MVFHHFVKVVPMGDFVDRLHRNLGTVGVTVVAIVAIARSIAVRRSVGAVASAVGPGGIRRPVVVVVVGSGRSALIVARVSILRGVVSDSS